MSSAGIHETVEGSLVTLQVNSQTFHTFWQASWKRWQLSYILNDV